MLNIHSQHKRIDGHKTKQFTIPSSSSLNSPPKSNFTSAIPIIQQNIEIKTFMLYNTGNKKLVIYPSLSCITQIIDITKNILEVPKPTAYSAAAVNHVTAALNMHNNLELFLCRSMWST